MGTGPGVWMAGVMLAAAVSGTPTPGAAPPPSCGCRAAVLMDADTGQVLYAYHAYRQMDPASLTKMMTAYVAIRAGRLDRRVTISPRAAATGGSRMHLAAGQVYTELDLLRGLLLRSGNDAAVALAEAVAGSVPAFVARMNHDARALGAYNTHFENPHGLTAPGHYSSAYDLARIARAALALPLFQHLVSSPADFVRELTRGRRRDLYNTNQLLETFPPADGIKTGTTSAAGKCLAASATVSGTQLITVVLDARDRFGAARALLDWGFRYFRPTVAARAGQPLATVRVRRGTVPAVVLEVPRTVRVLVPEGVVPKVFVGAPDAVAAPVRAGQSLGTAYVWADDRIVLAVPLQAAAAVPRRPVPLPPLFERLWRSLFRYPR
ncbi:MAG: D-alanyl-D-alanine carboxypeptidase [Actinomycetia bacterium]|nr:D-alanyl-D-alanine carboxypeptidase [Actinomycetes bacterium]